MKEAELVNHLIQWESYLHAYSPNNIIDFFSSIFRAISFQLIVGLAHIQDALNGLSVKALALLNIQNYPEFQAFMTKYMPLVVALAVIFMLVTLIGMMVNKGKDTSLFDFFKNLLIGMIVLIGFPFIWGQATKNTTDIAKYINQSSSMSTSVISQNITDLYCVGQNYDFNISKFNDAKDKKDRAGLALSKDKNFLEKDKNGNIKASELDNIDPNEVIDPQKPIYNLSKKSKEILTHKLQWGEETATPKKLDDGTLGYGKEHYQRYKINTFRILFYQLTEVLFIFFVTWKIGQLCFEVWFTGFFVQAVALFDLKKGKYLLKICEKFIITLLAILVVFVLQNFYNIGYSFIDYTISSNDLGGFLLNSILKLVLLFFVIDGPNIFEEVFDIDVGMKSVTGAIFGFREGSRMARDNFKNVHNLTRSISNSANYVAGGAKKTADFMRGTTSNFSQNKNSEEQNEMNKIGSDNKQKQEKKTTVTDSKMSQSELNLSSKNNKSESKKSSSSDDFGAEKEENESNFSPNLSNTSVKNNHGTSSKNDRNDEKINKAMNKNKHPLLAEKQSKKESQDKEF